ncbi:MAG TPA: class I SAM-dependent methyltransferase [Burkholderiaceae bacterium]|nr:class I SAM-dependent methyltransferase [Burkholderiaceae bacterium]
MTPRTNPPPQPYISWQEGNETRQALWCVPGDPPHPDHVRVVDDTLTADQAFRLASQGTAMLWRGDYRNARQLLVALAHRVDHRPRKRKQPDSPHDAFNQHRLAQSQRATQLNQLLIPMEGDGAVALRHAPDVRAACRDALGDVGEPFVLPLRAVQGMVGAHEWRRKGVAVPVLDEPIHVHYGVFSPIRGEYLDLIAQTPLPATDLAFDIGTGSGVLAAILARRGVARVVATDSDPRALACARENVETQGLTGRVTVQEADLFPSGACGLIVCNPPWLPARPTTSLESAIYDPGSRMLRGFLDGLADHLLPEGEGWLILSDLAERLGLRAPDFLATAIGRAGLRVVGRLDTRPRHPKVLDTSDPLHAARRDEVTTLWRLTVAHP